MVEGPQGRPCRRRWTKACETKPIPPGRSGRASALKKKSYDALDSQRASAKQSQLPCGQQWARGGQAVLAAGGTHREKQSQFAPHGPEEVPAGRAANAAAAGGQRAKQSQFRQSGTEGQVLCGKRVMTNWMRKRPRQNKANFHGNSSGRGSARRSVPPVGPIVRNKANLPCTDRKRRRLVGPEALPPLGTSVRNKANCRRQAGAMGLEPATVGRPYLVLWEGVLLV